MTRRVMEKSMKSKWYLTVWSLHEATMQSKKPSKMYHFDAVRRADYET